MAFPQSKLPITVELEINGVWTDISGDVRTQGGTDAIAIQPALRVFWNPSMPPPTRTPAARPTISL